jgi:hypothetical protein
VTKAKPKQFGCKSELPSRPSHQTHSIPFK